MINPDRLALWGQVDVPDDCPSDCPYMGHTEDSLGTGDSPTHYFCPDLNVRAVEAAENCPVVNELIG